MNSSDGRSYLQNCTKVTSNSPNGAKDKNNNNYITKKMMIAQDDFNSADQRRLTLNARSGPNPMLNLEEQPRRQTLIQKQKKNALVQH